MATLAAEQLLELKQIQLDLRTAIEAKGVVVGDAPFADYPGLVSSIIGGGVDTDPAASWEGEEVTWGGYPVTFSPLEAHGELGSAIIGSTLIVG